MEHLQNKEDVNMEAEELLEKWVREIDNLWIKNMLKFLWYGSLGYFKTIRNLDTIDFKNKNPEEDRIDAFIKICDGRIDRLKSDRLKSTSKDLVAVLIALGIILASILVGVTDNKHRVLGLLCEGDTLFLTTFLILFLVILAILRFRAQTYAWYAIKG